MTPMMSGFADELTKLSASSGSNDVLESAKIKMKAENSADSIIRKIPEARRKRKRNYLASSLLGAMAIPAAVLSGRGMTRVIKNVARPKGTKSISLLSKKDPLTTKSELAGLGTQGALTGSLTRALFDKIEEKSNKR